MYLVETVYIFKKLKLTLMSFLCYFWHWFKKQVIFKITKLVGNSVYSEEKSAALTETCSGETSLSICLDQLYSFHLLFDAIGFSQSRLKQKWKKHLPFASKCLRRSILPISEKHNLWIRPQRDGIDQNFCPSKFEKTVLKIFHFSLSLSLSRSSPWPKVELEKSISSKARREAQLDVDTPSSLCLVWRGLGLYASLVSPPSTFV
jgi:hypothetical protein